MSIITTNLKGSERLLSPRVGEPGRGDSGQWRSWSRPQPTSPDAQHNSGGCLEESPNVRKLLLPQDDGGLEDGVLSIALSANLYTWPRTRPRCHCHSLFQHLYVAWYCTENTTTEISFDRWASSSFMALANALMRCVAWSATGFWLDRPLTTDRNARERARRSDDLGFHRRLIARTRTLFLNFTDRFKSATTLMFLIDVIPNVLTAFHLTQRLFSLLSCLNYFQNILQVSFFLENIPLRARQCGFRARNDLDINYI